MYCLLLILLLSSTVDAWSLSKYYYQVMPPITDESCSFTRTDALHCFNKYVDVNPHDGGISPQEAQDAISRYSTPPIRALFWGWGSSQIFKACDTDKNGLITAKDWIESEKTCMPHKKNMCSLEWFCKRAEKIGVKASRV